MPSRRTKPPAARKAAATPPTPVSATRLVFRVDGESVTLLAQQPVEMAVTGADLAQHAHAGTYVDARDQRGRTLARVIARGMPEHHLEVFPEQHGDPIVRVPVERPSGAFSVVLPSPKAAVRVAVSRLEAAPAPRDGTARAAAADARDGAAALRAVDLGTFDLQRRP